jgi:GT2 family glycosyltransferase
VTAGNRRIDVSIVIVNWNVAALLGACIRSIESERDRGNLSIEIIVVDNASDQQDFHEVVTSYPDARLIELEENRGYGAASNVGIGLAQGRAVFILNPDIELLPHSLQRLWDTLNLSAHIGMVAPLLLNSDRTLQSSGYRFPGAANVFFDLFPTPARIYESALNGRVSPGNGQLPIAIDYALGAALFVRRAALLDVGMFDDSYFMYSEEIDLQRRLAKHGWTRLLTPDARAVHHGGQSTGQRADEMHVALWSSRAQYFERWASARDQRLVRTIVNAGTRLQDRRNPVHHAVNRRIRARFGQTSGSGS